MTAPLLITLACLLAYLLFVVLPVVAWFMEAGRTRNGDAEQMERRKK